MQSVKHSSRPYGVQQLQNRPVKLDDTVLACVLHGATAAYGDDPRVIAVDLPVLHGAGVELWTSPSAVHFGWDGELGFAKNDEILFGQLHLKETALAATETAVHRAYRQIDELLSRHGYPHWLRTWNFLSDINQGAGDNERYRQFVAGRYRAIAGDTGFEKQLPAATAIGSQQGGLLIYFLAGRSAGWQIENPRQVSAFRYPRQYGPRSPSFSRAMLVPWADQWELLVSGTASVVGHESLHLGEPMRQLEECVRNVEALTAEASRILGVGAAWTPQGCKLYLRASHAGELDAARQCLSRHLPGSKILALQGDICRTDLALEIEAYYTAPRP